MSVTEKSMDTYYPMNEGVKEVDEGIDLADKAGEALQEIVTISQKVTDMVAHIAAASEEKFSASEQISKNVEAISSVTQKTASGFFDPHTKSELYKAGAKYFIQKPYAPNKILRKIREVIVNH